MSAGFDNIQLANAADAQLITGCTYMRNALKESAKQQGLKEQSVQDAIQYLDSIIEQPSINYLVGTTTCRTLPPLDSTNLLSQPTQRKGILNAYQTKCRNTMLLNVVIFGGLAAAGIAASVVFPVASLLLIPSVILASLVVVSAVYQAHKQYTGRQAAETCLQNLGQANARKQQQRLWGNKGSSTADSNSQPKTSKQSEKKPIRAIPYLETLQKSKEQKGHPLGGDPKKNRLLSPQ